MDIKSIVAKNIAALRKHHKMTQLELAEKVNYSDKAVSRWESGDVTPDVETLAKLAEIFAIPLSSLLENAIDIDKIDKELRQRKINKLIIALLAITFIWTGAILIYIYSMTIDKSYYWEIFIYAFPTTFIVAAVFNSLWGKKKLGIFLASALIWTALLSIFIGTLSYNIWAIFILGAPLQIVVILWSKLHS